MRPLARRRPGAATLCAFALAAALSAAPAAAAGGGTGAGFSLTRGNATPHHAFFDGTERIALTYEFKATERLDLLVRVVRAGSGKPVRRWLERNVSPGRGHERLWDGLRANGKVAPEGSYEFIVGPSGHRGAVAGRIELHDYAFPVDGAHTYGDRFGDPRSGGRVHEGQDMPAGCGTPLVAARGGKVARTGYSDALYGYYVLIDGRETDADHFYAHLEAPTPLGEGERVRTGERIGSVGKTGNARGEFCQLHFELWPRGYHDGSPADPLAALMVWDSYS